MSIQYTATGFKPTTSQTWVVSHNNYARASALRHCIVHAFNGYWQNDQMNMSFKPHKIIKIQSILKRFNEWRNGLNRTE